MIMNIVLSGLLGFEVIAGIILIIMTIRAWYMTKLEKIIMSVVLGGATMLAAYLFYNCI